VVVWLSWWFGCRGGLVWWFGRRGGLVVVVVFFLMLAAYWFVG